MSEGIRPGIYRHYKGKLYRVVGVGRHSETMEPMVVYRAQYDSEEFGPHALWVRPLALFVEKVRTDGKDIPRFTYLGSETEP